MCWKSLYGSGPGAIFAGVSRRRGAIIKVSARCGLGCENNKQGSGVVLTLFHRAMPVAGLAVALIATVAWMGLLGYMAIKLF